MKRDINSDKNNYFNSEKPSHELGSQPRKSDARVHKSTQFPESDVDDDEESPYHRHRHEPNKNMVRVQLRRIERLF